MCSPLLIALAAGLLATPSQQGDVQGSRTRPPSRLLSPVRLAFGPTGEVLVSDHELERVCTLSADGQQITSSFTVSGPPSALGVLGDRVFVGIEAVQRVEIYHPNGLRLGVLGGAGCAIGDPRDLEIDAPQKRLYVVDGSARQVKVFDLATPEGQLLAAIGTPGNLNSDFQNPTGIALDVSSGELLVGDYGPMDSTLRPRVLVFGLDGTFRSWISGNGGPTGQYFARPQGLMIGASGHLFLVDAWRGEVVVMDRASGTQVNVVGQYGVGPGKLLLPLDLLSTGPDRDLWVTSSDSHCVMVFGKGGRL